MFDAESLGCWIYVAGSCGCDVAIELGLFYVEVQNIELAIDGVQRKGRPDCLLFKITAHPKGIDRRVHNRDLRIVREPCPVCCSMSMSFLHITRWVLMVFFWNFRTHWLLIFVGRYFKANYFNFFCSSHQLSAFLLWIHHLPFPAMNLSLRYPWVVNSREKTL